MITGHVFIATSLDGFIARPDGGIDWLIARDDQTEDHGYNTFMADMDAIIMGRGTFEAIKDMTPWYYTRPVLVLSATLAGQPVPNGLAGKVSFSAAPAVEAMQMLEAGGCRRVYVDGGQVIQSFLREGLITDMVITQVPVLIGEGRRLFGTVPKDTDVIHEGTTTFPSGLVQSRYRLVP